VRWWRRRTLRTRLAVLVAGAVAVGVVGVGVFAWAAVREDLDRMIDTQLAYDTQTIAAQPQLWRAAVPLPDPDGRDRGRGPTGDKARHRPGGLGPRWQILDPSATVVSNTARPLPVTTGARAVAAGQSTRSEEQVVVDNDRYRILTIPATGGGAVQVAINAEPSTRTLTEIGLLLIVACGIGVAGAALLGRTVARAGLAPVDRLTYTVEHIATTMDLNAPIPVSGQDEVARLSRSVNTLLAAIADARQAQRALVEDASHELRTPLTSIRTNIELLLAVERQPELAHRLPPEERAKLLRDLDTQLTELTTLTTELVELAREEATREVPEPVNLADVLAAALHRVRVRAPTLTFSTDLLPVTVHGRPGELERMVLNVLDNAAKWSPERGTVRVTLLPDGIDTALLTVTDDGPGIAEGDLPHVFDRFYRASTARAMPGSGLGLAIVAQSVAQHGGTVTAAPQDPHGTVVTIRLPRLIDSPALDDEHRRSTV
jgi:two-component system sensor histidine kinase MprB